MYPLYTTFGLERQEEMSKLEITLKSDLCAACGDGFSSVIDTDVSYDKYGFPFIGGRRIKGCLREAAGLIGSPYINEIFGVSGSRDEKKTLLTVRSARPNIQNGSLTGRKRPMTAVNMNPRKSGVTCKPPEMQNISVLLPVIKLLSLRF